MEREEMHREVKSIPVGQEFRFVRVGRDSALLMSVEAPRMRILRMGGRATLGPLQSETQEDALRARSGESEPQEDRAE